MPVTIPERLLQKLHSDSTYEGYVSQLIQNTKALITEKADFFPEYTIHGWSHVQAVLEHADKLIPDGTLEALAGQDVALLIAAVILHDLGMFLNEAGVRKLLGSTHRTARLDKRDWKQEWDRYIQEIKRYPEEKLLYHFGMSGAITEPDVKKGGFSDLERLIVGDFLRRHHHRIAHEIALDRMPGDTDVDVLQVGTDALGNRFFSTKDRKCIGILARSHGMAIRDTWEYIKFELGRQYPEKLTYLMAVLRIADLLDADEQRAPDTLRKLEGIRTPVSLKEWVWNQRIVRTDLDWTPGADHKYVEAEPQSTTEFVHLEQWLTGVQRELDLCWAVLSEVCDTQKYRLSIHRIESNILEQERRESYGEKFITRDARLNANPELLKLLVAPLYDNDPSCGVRELLQNAVDACSERRHLEGDSYRGRVEIRLDTEARTLTVTDNGIGMDENVLLNYYLSAGASYRTSDQWFENFATDRDPDIVRTGRFGVGVLATFLLGNQVEVTTRHMDDEFGYSFEFGLEPKGLDIRRPEAAPEIGTAITVTLKEDALEKLKKDYEKEKKWLNWYRFEEPSVRYWVDGEEYVSDKPFVPQDDREMPGWFELPGTEFELVRWGYPEDGFFCNGFRIPYGVPRFNRIMDAEIPVPSVSVVDKKGVIQVDLSRRILGEFSHKMVVRHESFRYALAQLLAADWSSDEIAAKQLECGIWKYQNRGRVMHAPCICNSESYTLLWAPLFSDDCVFPVLTFWQSDKSTCRELVTMLRMMDISLPILVYPRKVDFSEKLKYLLPFSRSSQRLFSAIYYSTSVDRVWMPEQIFLQVANERKSYRNIYPVRRKSSGCAEYIHKDRRLYLRDTPFEWEHWDSNICPAISEMRFSVKDYFDRSSTDDTERLFGKMVKELMGDDPWIPYDMEERRKKFPKAFEELKYYIDRILADREKEKGAT